MPTHQVYKKLLTGATLLFDIYHIGRREVATLFRFGPACVYPEELNYLKLSLKCSLCSPKRYLCFEVNDFFTSAIYFKYFPFSRPDNLPAFI